MLEALWVYPVKSMQGEAIAAAALADGLPGDRRYAVVDAETGLVASAKHPRRWAGLLRCRATAAGIRLPDGASVGYDDADLDARLSAALGRPVRLGRARGAGDRKEADRGAAGVLVEGLGHAAPGPRYWDVAPIHVVTTGTLARLGDVRRFRPNLVVAGEAFAEAAWLGGVLAVGGARLRVIDPTPRCVVTTLAQAGLPADAGVLRALAGSRVASVTLAPGHVFAAVAGVYATIEVAGEVRVGDGVRFLG